MMNSNFVPPARRYSHRPDLQGVFKLMNDLAAPKLRKNAIAALSTLSYDIPDFGPILWNSYGTISILLREIIMKAYSVRNPPNFSISVCEEICQALTLLRSVAAHPETKPVFLTANIHMFIVPLLNIQSNTLALEYLKLTVLGVIAALVTTKDTRVIDFLIRHGMRDLMPHILTAMEAAPDMSKKASTYILQRILLLDNGLSYVCENKQNIWKLIGVLENMSLSLSREPSPMLAQRVIKIFLRLSEDPRARELLHYYLPASLKDDSLIKNMKDADADLARTWLINIHHNLASMYPPMPMLTTTPPPNIPHGMH